MENRIKNIETHTIELLLIDISKGFLVTEKNGIVVQDYRKHFDLYSKLCGDYTLNRELFDNIYPAIKKYKWAEFLEVTNRFKHTQIDSDGIKVVLILIEELKNRKQNLKHE